MKRRELNKMKRRAFMIFLAAVIAFAGMPIIYTSAGIADDIEISYDIEETRILEGNIFTLYFTIDEVHTGEIDSIGFKIETNQNFKVLNGNSDVANAELGKTYSVNLQYLGGSNSLPIKIKYVKDGKDMGEPIMNIEIDEIDEDSVDPPSSSSGNEPKLIIESSSIPVAAAGETMKIPITVTNESRYSAKDISVKLTLSDSDDNPFEISSLNLVQSISSLNAKKSDGLIFSLKVKPYAEEKTYEINIQFSYYNSKNNLFASNEKIYVKVTNSKNEPVLMIQDIKHSTYPVKAGGKFQVSFDAANVGGIDAKGVKVSVEGLNKDGFTLYSGVNSWYFDSIAGNGKKNITVDLVAADSMESGNHGLEIKLEYKDQRNNSYTGSSSFFVNVQGESKSSNVALKNISVMPKEVKVNENFTLSFDVHNEGKTAARNVKMTIKGDEGIISKSPDVRIIENLAAGEQEKLEYILYANNEAKTQNYNILISLEYEDAEKEGSKYSVNQYAGVYVNGGNSKITPKIIISNYNFEPKLVRAGEEFSMDLTFMNTSMTKEVKNVKIYLTGIDSDKEGNVVFTPVGSSNTFFVDSIKPKGTALRSITMFTIPDAQPKYYNITANIEYQDNDGTEYKAEELVGIPVIQQSKLDASEIGLPPEIYIGQPTPISLQYYNKGKTKLSNLMIKVEGDFQIENGEAFIGNFESGSSDYYEAMITAMNPGTAAGKVVFSFEDPSGDEFTYEREFSINAIEMPQMEMPGGEMPMPPVSTKDKIMNNTIKNKFFWIGIVVIAAAVFTSRRLIRKKRRKDMDLDE
jgi:hypothetical protein